MNVTVVVPTRNRAPLLRRTVRTILNQELVDVRLVIIDDASQDDTSTWLASLDDAKVTVIRHPRPCGVSAARNAGLRFAETDWVAFCDDDDLWAPRKLWRQLLALEHTPGARWASCGVISVDDELVINGWHHAIGGDIAPRIAAENLIPSGSTVLVESELLRAIGGFDQSLHWSEDWDCWIRLAQHSPLAVDDTPLVAYRIAPGTASSQVRQMRHCFELVAARYAYLADRKPDRFAYDRYLAKQQLRAGCRVDAARAYLDLARTYRRPGPLLRAAGALLAPALTDRLGTARARHAVPAAWAAAAQEWLVPLRAMLLQPTHMPAT